MQTARLVQHKCVNHLHSVITRVNFVFSESSMEDDENNLLKKLKKFYRDERLNKTHHLNRLETCDQASSRRSLGKSSPSGRRKSQTGNLNYIIRQLNFSFLIYFWCLPVANLACAVHFAFNSPCQHSVLFFRNS